MIDVFSIRPNTVSVLIGPNGSGKSRQLRKLCYHLLRRGDHVIAIAPTIYDRFRRLPRKTLSFFGARSGRTAAKNVVRTALTSASAKDPLALKNLTQALAYTNFDPVVGISISKPNRENLFRTTEKLSKLEAEELHGALRKWESHNGHPEIIRVELDSFSFKELDTLSFAVLARHEDLLRKTKVVSRMKYFLFRKGKPIQLLEACSGELCFITTVAFISNHITRGSVIAIDEPETSLHPTWQRDYVQTLLNIFYRYEPRIIISTHSPIIISGAEADERPNMSRSEVSVYEMTDGQARIFDHGKLSLEEMYDRLFGLITPKNHYLSQRAVEMFNALNSGDLSLDQVLHEFEELRNKSYDESQRAVISKFEEMAHKLISMKKDKAGQ